MRRLARARIERAARDIGVTEHANESARRLLRTLFSADGYTTDVSFRIPLVVRGRVDAHERVHSQ